MQGFRHKMPRIFTRIFLADAIARQRPHVFLWAPVFIALGILAYFLPKNEPSLFVFFAAGACPVVLCLWLYQNVKFRIIIFFITCVAAGFMASKIRTELVHTHILKNEIKFAQVHGTIEHVENFVDNSAVRVSLKDITIENVPVDKAPDKIRIKFRKTNEPLRAGQKISILSGLNPPSPPALPGGFDFQRYMYYKSIGAVGFAYGTPEIESKPVGGIKKIIENLRNDVASNLTQHLTIAGGVAAALMVGQRTAISENDQEAMRHAGLAHMLAISGLHIGLFFGVVFFIVRLLLALIPQIALNKPIKKYAAICALSAATFYMLIAGATIPTQRALLMTSIVFLAIMIDRTPLSMRLVAFSAIVVLLIAPESLMSASFQMSFSAVAALVAFYTVIRPFWSRIHRKAGILKRIGLYVLGVSFTTIVATFATAPFALYHFQSLAIYSLAANILAMPILAFIVMPFCVLYYFLLPIGLESLSLPAIGWGISQILAIAHFVSSLNYAVFHVILWPASLIATFASGYAIILLTEGRMRLIGLIPIALFFIAILKIQQPDILISANADLIAFKGQNNQLIFSDLRKERFTREQWSTASAMDTKQKPAKFPKEGVFEDMQCGEHGCRFERNKIRVAYINDASKITEECGWADIIISNKPLPECGSAITIGRFETFKNGAYAIYLQNPPLIKTVAEMRGKRPWVADAQK